MNDLAQGVHANVTVFNVEADSYWTFLCSLIGNQNGCDGEDDYMCHVGVGMKSIMPTRFRRSRINDRSLEV